MTPFLQLVAQVYLENERRDMMDYCFVFPNKRSGVFFRHYLISLSQGQPLILPAISTIGELTGQFTDLVEASRFEQLFTLYNEYRALNGDVADFDRFMFWGEMILSDFNDVDRDLVDPDKLFINLKRYREVSANYLTEEQQEILSRYWGESFDRYSPDEFWTHLHTDNPSELERHFLQLWEVLSPLYGRFTTTLRSRGVGTQGMMMRDAIEKLRIVETSELQYSRYIFVGFSMLSLSEFRIFDNLKQRGVADFYWDDASPALKTIGNKVVAFMRRNRDNFPSRHSLPDEEIRMPEVKVTGIPSAIGQTKKAGEQLQKWVKQEVVDPQNAISTAVVLPDESLLIPMIHSVPEEITSLNVTMGLPLRSTAFASFVNAVITMQLRSYRTADGIHKFFHDDVKTLLSFPMLRRIDPSGSVRIMHLITDNRLYMVPASRIAEEAPELMFVFTPIADSESIEATYGYFNTLFTTLQSFLPEAESDDKKDAGDSVITSNDVEAYYIESYIDALNELRGALVRFSVDMHDTTFIRLLQKATAGITVSLAGKPLTGLQLMGVLETRALDFENIIILSMNERVFPRKHYTRSFIPDSLRRAYGMATADKQEAIYAYYFYRLISRASNVTLLYDARSSGGKSNEISRYVAQLLYLFSDINITHSLDSYATVLPEHSSIEVKKTEEIMNKLREFTIPGGRTLSASTINEYINCPLAFYLNRLCGLKLEEETIDYMDAATFGTIIHEIVETIYKNMRGDASEVKVTPEMIERTIRDEVALERLITTVVNKCFNRLSGESLSTPLVGEALVLSKVIKHFIVLMLKQEMKIAPFDFIDSEYRISGTFELNSGLTINIRQIIDRIDRYYPAGKYGEPTAGFIRIIDYKTGSDKTSFGSMDDLFDNNIDGRRKAILQLLFYCNAYARQKGIDGQIQPVIYVFNSMSTQGITPISVGERQNKMPLENYQTVNKEFLERFSQTIEEMFNPEIPFRQAPTDHNCKFCSFKVICRRNPK